MQPLLQYIKELLEQTISPQISGVSPSTDDGKKVQRSVRRILNLATSTIDDMVTKKIGLTGIKGHLESETEVKVPMDDPEDPEKKEIESSVTDKRALAISEAMRILAMPLQEVLGINEALMAKLGITFTKPGKEVKDSDFNFVRDFPRIMENLHIPDLETADALEALFSELQNILTTPKLETKIRGMVPAKAADTQFGRKKIFSQILPLLGLPKDYYLTEGKKPKVMGFCDLIGKVLTNYVSGPLKERIEKERKIISEAIEYKETNLAYLEENNYSNHTIYQIKQNLGEQTPETLVEKYVTKHAADTEGLSSHEIFALAYREKLISEYKAKHSTYLYYDDDTVYEIMQKPGDQTPENLVETYKKQHPESIPAGSGDSDIFTLAYAWKIIEEKEQERLAAEKEQARLKAEEQTRLAEEQARLEAEEQTRLEAEAKEAATVTDREQTIKATDTDDELMGLEDVTDEPESIVTIVPIDQIGTTSETLDTAYQTEPVTTEIAKVEPNEFDAIIKKAEAELGEIKIANAIKKISSAIRTLDAPGSLLTQEKPNQDELNAFIKAMDEFESMLNGTNKEKFGKLIEDLKTADKNRKEDKGFRLDTNIKTKLKDLKKELAGFKEFLEKTQATDIERYNNILKNFEKFRDIAVELKQFASSIQDLPKEEGLQELASETLLAAKKLLEGLSITADDFDAKFAEIEAKVEKIRNLTQKTEPANALVAKLTVLETEFGEIPKAATELKKQAEDLYAELKRKLAGLKEGASIGQTDIDSATQVITNLKALLEQKEKLSQLEKVIGTLPEAEELRKFASEALTKAKKSLGRLTITDDSFTKDLKIVTASLAEIKKLTTQAESANSLLEALDNLEKMLETTPISSNEDSKLKEGITTLKDELTAKLDELKKGDETAEGLTKEQQVKLASLDELNKQIKEIARLKTKAEEINDKNLQRAALESLKAEEAIITSLDINAEDLSDQLESIKTHVELEDQISILENDHKEEKNETTKEKLSVVITTARELLSAYRGKKGKIEEIKNHLKNAVEKTPKPGMQDWLNAFFRTAAGLRGNLEEKAKELKRKRVITTTTKNLFKRFGLKKQKTEKSASATGASATDAPTSEPTQDDTSSTTSTDKQTPPSAAEVVKEEEEEERKDDAPYP